MFTVERQGNIAILRMQYGSANAMDVDFCRGLTHAVLELSASSSRAIVLTGQGQIFSAGVDLPRVIAGGVEYIRRFLPALAEVLETLFFCPKPLIAAVNGHAIAGGCLLTCVADRRLMVSGKARIGVPELRVGVPFPTVAMEIMRARTGPGYYEEVVLGGGTYAAADALKLGLIDAVVEEDELLKLAVAAGEALAAIRPEIYAISKHQARQPVRAAIETGLRLHEARIGEIWEQPETLEAIRAFVARTLKK
jgi:enoyl-CoA hydratase